MGDGTFFLVQQHSGSTQWNAQRFAPASQGVTCLGHTAGQGTVVDDPIHTTNGVVLPVLDQGIQRFTALSPSNLSADDPNCLFAVSLPPAALYATSGVTLGDRTTVVHPSGGFSPVDSAGGTVSLGVSASVGDVLSIGPITLANNATIKGEAKSTGAITLGAGSQVTSGSDPLSSVLLPPLPTMNVTFPSRVNDVDLEPGVVRTLAPGGYGNVAIKSHATLMLSAGVYTFTTLDLEPQATLSLDQSAGSITIDIQNAMVLFRGSVTRSSQASAPFLIAYFGSQDAFIEARRSRGQRDQALRRTPLRGDDDRRRRRGARVDGSAWRVR